MKKLFFVFFLTISIGCESDLVQGYDDNYDIGFDDGYAVGYNTTCEIRATFITGNWDSQGYSDGYNDGYRDGSEECIRDRRAGRVR